MGTVLPLIPKKGGIGLVFGDLPPPDRGPQGGGCGEVLEGVGGAKGADGEDTNHDLVRLTPLSSCGALSALVSVKFICGKEAGSGLSRFAMNPIWTCATPDMFIWTKWLACKNVGFLFTRTGMN